MAFKFPFTNYHELNLTWVLEQLKQLFEESEENVETIEGYEDRLSAVETEVTDLESTTSQAINTANAAATNASTALSRANTANQNALTASSQAGAAVTAAQESQQEAQAATQAAQQAQATAMTFDGRITQAQNDASAAVHEAESFENRVNAAINTANNAANTATIAQGIAVNANQTAAQALDAAQTADGKAEAAQDTADQNADNIGDLSDLTTTAKNNLVAAINEAAQTGGGTDDTKAPLIVENASGDIVSIKDGANNMAIRHLIATINPIQAGTGDPSPTNIRLISGRTGLTGARTGKNLFNLSSLRGGNYSTPADFPTSNIVIDDYLPIKGGVTYIWSQKRYPQAGGRYVNWYDAEKRYISDESIYSAAPYVLTAPDNACYVRPMWYQPNPQWSSIDDIIAEEPLFEVGTTTSEYEPYQGNTISVSWDSEVGTIYGGALDLVTGKITVNRMIVDMGSLNWAFIQPSSSIPYGAFYVTIYNKEYGQFNLICSNYPVKAGFGNDGTIQGNSAASTVYVVDSSFNGDVNAFKVAVTGAQLVYEINFSNIYQLDPITVSTLYGNNTIFVDSGPVSVDYPADTKLYIDGKIAELQALILEN